jgi:predicted membrane protein
MSPEYIFKGNKIKMEANMKMSFLSSGVFWGAVLVLFGISVLLKAVFHIDVPVFRILVGLVIIYFGLKVLTGWRGFSSPNTVVFSDCSVSPKEIKGDYSVVFARGYMDLSNADIKDKSVTVRVHTVFGETTILVDKNMPVKVQAEAVFSGVKMADGNVLSIGNLTYLSPSYKEGDNCLIIKSDSVFVSLKIVNK